MSMKPKSKTVSSPRHLVVLSDLHVGSTVGIWPKNHRNRYGQVAQLSPLQEWLHDCWVDGVEWVNKVTNGSYVLGLNGDLIEGKHHRATEVMTPLIDDQVDACISLLSPLASKAHSVYATLGTEAHTGECEHGIASALKARKFAPWSSAHNSVCLDINGVPTELMHHISTTSRPWLEASGHSIALNQRRAEKSRLGEIAPNVLIRGHRHRFGYFCDGRGMTVVTPSWQALTRWAWKVIPGAEFSVGFTVIDYSDLEDGIIPRVRFRLYSPEADPIVKVH